MCVRAVLIPRTPAHTGWGEAGLPPKKPGVYDADLDDCRAFFDSWLAQLAGSAAGWDGWSAEVSDVSPADLAAALATAVEAGCTSACAPDTPDGLFPAVADSLFAGAYAWLRCC